MAKKQQRKEPKGQEERAKQGKIHKEYQSIVFELRPLTRAAVYMANTDLHVRPNLDRHHSRTRTRDIAVPPELLAQWDVQLSQGEGRA